MKLELFIRGKGKIRRISTIVDEITHIFVQRSFTTLDSLHHRSCTDQKILLICDRYISHMNGLALHSYILLLIVLLIAVPCVAANSAEIASPPVLKDYVASTPSVDDHFFEQVTGFMTRLSGGTVSSGDDFWFFTLLASGYNIEEHELAQKLITFLFYTGKAGQHYEQYRANWEVRFTPVNANAEYTLAQEYLTLAKKVFDSCEACKELYPDFVMYSLPEKEQGSSAPQFTGRLGF